MPGLWTLSGSTTTALGSTGVGIDYPVFRRHHTGDWNRLQVEGSETIVTEANITCAKEVFLRHHEPVNKPFQKATAEVMEPPERSM